MFTYIKTQAASILGSGTDYLTTVVLVEIFHWGYLPANAAGNIFGGTAQFILCSNWVFKVGKERMRVRILKFILVFIGNLLLSSAGIYFFTHYVRINYIISKTITSVLLGISYNYWMQKKFVFS